MKRGILIVLLMSILLSAQQINFKSSILDAQTREPLAKASILLLGTTTGTMSDEEGNFSIKVDANLEPIIKISYVGYETQYIPLYKMPDLMNQTILMSKKLIPAQTIIVTSAAPGFQKNGSNFDKIEAAKIKGQYTFQDIPQFLSSLPSVNWYSDNGNGAGYNYLSIRGFDQRRIAVMVNGIPQNEPEDHNVYWLDFSDILGNADLIQVQRGTGAGIFGYPAVGGAINIMTSSGDFTPSFSVSAHTGAYNTRKYSLLYNSGLVDSKYSFMLKFSNTLSNGYRDKSWSDLSSYYFSVLRFDDNLTTQFNMYGGPVADGLAYTGLPKFAIKDKKLRRENYSDWSGDKEYTSKTIRRNEEIENFSQPHFEILNDYKFSSQIQLNSALFLILGKGFFDYDGSWAPYSYYRLTPENGFSLPAGFSNPDDIYMSNVLAHAWVQNRQWGWIPRANIKISDAELNVGAEFRFHRSYHYGSVKFANGAPAELTPDFKYYEYNGAKNVVNLFGNYIKPFSDNIKMLWEVQLSYNQYRFYGEKYLGNSFNVGNYFVNPKMGIGYKLDSKTDLYATVALVGREPRLKEYYNAAEATDPWSRVTPQFALNPDGTYDYGNPLVKPEYMSSVEIGGSTKVNDVNLNANIYFMNFDNEIVKNGLVDRFGQPMTGNMPRTSHFGLELSAVYFPMEELELTGNATLSVNRIVDGTTYITQRSVYSGNDTALAVDLTGNSIAGMPGLLFNAQAVYRYENLLVKLNARYVGSFYSDNYGDKLGSYKETYPKLTKYSDNVNDAYFNIDLFASYEMNNIEYLKKVKVFLQIINLFDSFYSQNAVGKEFFPGPEISLYTGFTVNF